MTRRAPGPAAAFLMFGCGLSLGFLTGAIITALVMSP